MQVTAETVALWGKFSVPTGDERALLDGVVSAVVAHVEAHYVVADPLTDDQSLAMVMAAARLWKRRSTPEGIQAFGDQVAIRVTSLDPDVEKLLSRKWGFA